MNKKRIRNQQAMRQFIANLKSLPDELKAELISWEEIVKSPYSLSFYSSRGKRWDHTPSGCKRISNHWNFKHRKKPENKGWIHCKTDIPVKNQYYWTYAIFENGLWRVQLSLPCKKKK